MHAYMYYGCHPATEQVICEQVDFRVGHKAATHANGGSLFINNIPVQTESDRHNSVVVIQDKCQGARAIAVGQRELQG